MELEILMRGDSEARDNLESRTALDSDSHEQQVSSTICVDVFETDKSLVVIAPIAGTDLNNLEVQIADNEVLEIHGKSSVHEFISETEYLLQECHFGDFSRSILLPPGLDTSKVRATYKKGILRVEIPKISAVLKSSSHVIQALDEQELVIED
jgi:HSP20 family protein